MAKKRGRPAKPGMRYPGGKLKPQFEPMSGVLWQRLKTHGRQLGLDSRLTTELGRLNWFGEFTLAQTVAGHRIAEIYGRYERDRGLRRSAKSPSYERSYGEIGVAEELLSPQAMADRERSIRDTAEAWRGLQGDIPHHLRTVIEDLCVSDRTVNPALYPDIREILDYFAVRWKISSTSGKGGPKPSTKARTETAPDAARLPRPNLDRIYWVEVARKLDPDAETKYLEELYDEMQARKQRDRFRQDKERALQRNKPMRAVG